MNGFCLGQYAQLILGNLFQTVKALCLIDSLLDHFCVVGFQIGKDSQLSDGSDKAERFDRLKQIAEYQLRVLTEAEAIQKLPKGNGNE